MMFVVAVLCIIGSTQLFASADGQRSDQYGGRFVYSSELLRSLQGSVATRYLYPLNIDFPAEIIPTAKTGKVRKKRKRGKKGGLKQKLRNMENGRLPLPSVIMSNVRSLRGKMDELQANVSYMHEYKHACLLAFTETWLDNDVRDEDLSVNGFGTPVRLDRNKSDTGKSQGGGVCLFVNRKWCNTIIVRESLCTPDIELLSVSLRPYYSPREFPQLFFTLVYIHPRARHSTAIEQMCNTMQKLDSICPDAPKFILGDFNHCTLDQRLKMYHQYVTCLTRLNKTIDLCYGTIPSAYKSYALPPLGSADHNTVLLAPSYRPVIQRVKTVVKTVKDWTSESIMCLQACFDCTQWSCFYDTSGDIYELTDGYSYSY